VYAMAIMKPETYHDEPFPSSAYGKNIETTTFNIKN